MRVSLPKAALAALFALCSMGAQSMAGVPKVVWIEEFGATW
jgi:hypothetical protein